MPSFLMQQLELFPPKIELKPIPPEAEDPDFLNGINFFLMASGLPLRIYSIPPSFNPELIYKIWHLEAEKGILGLYSEGEIWELVKAFRSRTNSILWRWQKEIGTKNYFLCGAVEISILIEEIICPHAQKIKEQRKVRFMGHG